jgi:hypothetical protein
MRVALLALLAVSAALVSCDDSPETSGPAEDENEATGTPGGDGDGDGDPTGGDGDGDGDGLPFIEPEGPAELFGAPITRGAELIAFDELVATPEAFEGQNLLTLGVVRANCNKRGCWMEVRSPEDSASAGMTVRFVDYGFFIPLDSRGATVKVQGEVTVEILSPSEVEDLVSEGYDAGVLLPDGSAEVVSFTASGVEMWGR